MLQYGKTEINNQLVTFEINSLKEATFGSCPLIPTWHSYIRKDFGTLGCLCLQLYARSGDGSQCTAKA